MEKRKLNISFTKSGQGNISTRIILPISWIKELGITQEGREVFVYKFDEEIIIRRTPLEFNKEEAIKLAVDEIKSILGEKKYFDFNTKIKVAEKILLIYFDKDSKEYKRYFNSILGGIDDWSTNKTKLISYKEEFYYYTPDLNFSNFEDFKKYFGLKN